MAELISVLTCLIALVGLSYSVGIGKGFSNAMKHFQPRILSLTHLDKLNRAEIQRLHAEVEYYSQLHKLDLILRGVALDKSRGEQATL